MNVGQIAHMLSASLALDTTPVALTRTNEVPAGVPLFGETVPSACSFWRRAEREVFYASADQHMHCPIGAMVMGFDLSDSAKAEIGSLVGLMVQEGYLDKDEPARIPSLSPPRRGVVYGPLAQFPIDPEFILMWLKPSQAMLVAEATGASHWKSAPNGGAVLGRPACGAIPLAGQRGTAAVSFGCAGMRTFTEVAEDRLLGVLPAGTAMTFVTALGNTAQVNRIMAGFYAARKNPS
jgi:uncharacterized protein (DUF169 family)